jgi:type II secretory pathway pseudopilin PulG
MIYKNKGFTLIETLVYSVLLIIILGTMYTILSGAMENYYTIRSGVDVQKASISSVNRITKELSESNLASIAFYKTKPKGIVFMSPKTADNMIEINQTTGKPYWQKYVCYYMEDDPSDISLSCIIRKEKTVTQTDTPSVSNVYTTSYFATGGGKLIKPVVIATSVSNINIYWMNNNIISYTSPPVNPIFISIDTFDRSSNKSTNNISTFTTLTSAEVIN